MSTFLGNICLIIAGLVFSLLFTPFFQTKVSTSNDQGATGYVMIIIMLLHVVFLGLILAACIPIARQGGFDWISKTAFTRNTFLIVGLLSMVIVSAICLMNRLADSQTTPFLEKLMFIAPMVILFVIITGGVILNNNLFRDAVPVALYKWPILFTAAACLVSILWIGFTVMTTRQVGMAESTQRYENAPGITDDRLSQINQADVMTEQVWLLELTGSLYPPQVREKASEKFKTRPDWQDELIRILESDHALAAFSFLAANEVEDKSLFPEAVNKGALYAATWIRSTIQATLPSDFEPTMYSDEVNRILATIDKFDGMGTDFLPAVKEMRSSLDEPVAGKKIKFNCSAVLDSWIKKHE